MRNVRILVTMLLAPRHFVGFLDGRYGTVQQIAFIPGEFTRLIGSLSSDLLIRRDYALKLQREHGLRYEQFQLIQPAIDAGYVLIDDKQQLVFLYIHNTREFYRLAVKTAKMGSELWLLTFHRVRQLQFDSLLRRYGLLREHEE